MSEHAQLEASIRDAFADMNLIVGTSDIIHKAERIKRRRQVTFIAGPVTALAVGAGGYALLTAEDAPKASVTCFDQAFLPGSDTSVSATAADASSGGPVESCTTLWSQGLVKEGSTTPPEMTACLNQQFPGSVWVFPGGKSVCGELGLQDIPPGYGKLNEEFVAMRVDLINSLRREALSTAADPSQACLDESAARRIANEVLTEHGFTDWRVVLSSARKPDECAQNPHFDDIEKTVTIGPTDPGELPRGR